jgi:hypothetical protein
VDAVTAGQAGIMIRNPGDAQAAFVALVVDATGTLRLLSRQDDGAAPTAVQRTGFNAGTWLRLQQDGNTFTAYTSRDGASWTRLDTARANLAAAARAGVGVASDDPARRAAATLSHVAAGASLFQDVTASAKITQSGFTLNRTNGLWTGTVTFTNVSTTPLNGTLLFRLDGLTGGVTLANASAIQDAYPVLALPVASLAPGASVSATTSFVNPNRVLIGYRPKLYIGTL